MRTRTLLPARVSLAVVLVSLLGSCTPRALDRTFAERPVFVELPASGIATPAQRAAYDGNPVAVERNERRCTYKPAAGAACASSVELRVMVAEGARSVAAGGHPHRPLLLGIVENRGTRATFDGILPGENALVAENKVTVGGRPETVVKLVQFAKTGTPNFAFTQSEYVVLRDCVRHYTGRSSDMTFTVRVCDSTHSTMRRGSSDHGVLVTSLVTSTRRHGLGEVRSGKSALNATDGKAWIALDDPLWLRCSPGCCTSMAASLFP